MDIFIIFEESPADGKTVAAVFTDMLTALDRLSTMADELEDEATWSDDDTRFEIGHYSAWIENYISE